MRFLPLVALALSSCVYYKHDATSASGNHETDVIASLGGTSSQRGADGSSFVHDHQQSFRDGAVAVETIAGGIVSGNVTKAVQASNNAKDTAAGAQATQVTLGAQQAATAQAGIAAKSDIVKKAIDAGAKINPITVTGP